MNPEYPANLREFCRRLHERGRSVYYIHKQLQARGVDPVPHETTIHTWVDDEYAEKRRLSARRFGTPGPRRNYAWELRLDRMRALREAKVGFRAIAAVMMLDCPEVQLNENQVRRILNGESSRQTVRDLLWPQGASKARRGRPPVSSASSAGASERSGPWSE